MTDKNAISRQPAVIRQIPFVFRLHAERRTLMADRCTNLP